MLAVSVVLALAVAACSPKPATEIVLRIDSNMGPALHAVHIVLDRGAGTHPISTNDYPIGPMFTIPGTVAVVPSNPDDTRPIRVQATAVTGDPATTFTTTVSLAFAPQRTLVLDIFLAAECESAAVRSLCTGSTTCGPGGACVPIAQPTREFMPDAARVDAPVAQDAPADSLVTDALDATDVSPMDAPTDSGPTDVPMDLPMDIPIDSPADLPAPRLIAPMSTSTVSLQTPTLHWLPPAGTTMFDVQLCTARACTSVAHHYTATGSSFRVTDVLTPGVWFWRVASVCGAHVCPTTSATWQFIVPRPHTIAPAATVDTSFGTALDVNGDGHTDIAVGGPAHLNMASGSTGSFSIFTDMTSSWTGTEVIIHGPPGVLNFGQALASAGDVNGDGFGDLVVCDPMGGRFFVYNGGPSGLPSGTAPSQTLTAPAGMAGFGSSVASAGDIDGDGYADVIFGAPGTASNAGGAYIRRGSAGGLTATGAITLAAPAGGAFGTSVAAAGDLDGDGFGDVVVGAPMAGPAGMAYVYPGSATGLMVAGRIDVAADTGAAAFGTSVAGAGDMDGDGRSDFVVGGPGSMGGAGRGVIFLGSAALTSGVPWHAIAFPTSMYFGAGTSIATGGDIDGDGLADVVLGGPHYQQAQITGCAFVALSGTTPTFSRSQLPLLTHAGVDHAWGTAVLIGDFDNNGYADVALTDPRATGGNYGAALYMNTAGTLGAPAQMTFGFFDQFGASIAMSSWSSRRFIDAWPAPRHTPTS